MKLIIRILAGAIFAILTVGSFGSTVGAAGNPATVSIGGSSALNKQAGGSSSSTLNPPARAGASEVDTITTLTSFPNPSAVWTEFTVTATVTGSQPGLTPTGSVDLIENGTLISTESLSGGSISFPLIAFAAQSLSYTAYYHGDANYNPSTSNLVIQVISDTLIETTTTLTGSPNPSTYSQSVIFTASVTSSGVIPTGNVEFKDKNTSIGTAALDGTGTATLTNAALLGGNHAITAYYQGNASYSGSKSTPLTQVVNQASTTTALTSSLNPSNMNQSVTFTATISADVPWQGIPTGTVSFLEGGATIGTATISGGTASFSTSSLTAGSHSITASYGSDSNFISSVSPILTQNVNPTIQYTVHYVNSITGQPAAPDKTGVGNSGDTITEHGIFINGYIAIGASTQSITLSPASSTITFQYMPVAVVFLMALVPMGLLILLIFVLAIILLNA